MVLQAVLWNDLGCELAEILSNEADLCTARIHTRADDPSASEACCIRMDHWTGERGLLANRTFVLKLALAEECDEGSLAALTTMLVGRPSVVASKAALGEAGKTSAGPAGNIRDFDHPALRTDEGFLFFGYTCRDATDE